MKRLFTFTLALSMLLTLLAGCGGDDSKTPDAANSPPPGDISGSGGSARDDVTVRGNMIIDNFNPGAMRPRATCLRAFTARW